MTQTKRRTNKRRSETSEEWKSSLFEFLYAGRWYYGVALFAGAILMIIEKYTAPPPEPTTAATWIGIGIGWLVFAMGLAWIQHGFGFLIVKVN